MAFVTDVSREHRFAPCAFVAFRAATQLLHGELLLLLEGGKEPVILPKPTWHRFHFFTDFYASRIQSDDVHLAVGRQLKRMAMFYYRNHSLITMELVGVVIEGFKHYGVELASEWALKSIDYRMEFWADSPDTDREPPLCKQFAFEITGYSK